MAGRIPEQIINEVLDRNDIVEVISGYIPLKKAGANYKALCPFHHEKTPSFMVHPAKQIFHCFGCGVGGNVFHFIMKHERLEFPEAVRQLAGRVGVVIPETGNAAREDSSLTAQVFRANEIAGKYFRESLFHPQKGTAGRTYLERRGIKPETISEFGLGYAPDFWSGLIDFARGQGIDEPALLRAGLVIPREGKSGNYDRFRGRLMFPILDLKRRIVGFGGRMLADGTPKYINSPETVVYTKGKCLYGLENARDAIRQQDAVAIVEGYFDLITCFQEGIKNVVASSGTALTPDHARVIRRFTRNVVLIYDADQAGEQATLRGLDLLLEEELQVQIVGLPTGFDPDSFVRRQGAEALNRMIREAQSLFDYKLQLLLKKFGTRKVENKIGIIQEMLPTITRVKNAVLASSYVRQLAERLDVREEAVRAELKKVKGERRVYAAAVPETAGEKEGTARGAEVILLRLMLAGPGMIGRVRERLRPEDFQDRRLRAVVEQLFELPVAGKEPEVETLFNLLPDEAARGKLAEVVMAVPLPPDRETALADCLAWIETDSLKRRLKELSESIENAQEKDDLVRLQDLSREYTELIRNRTRPAGTKLTGKKD